MKLRDLSSLDDVHYSWTDGGFHRKFTHKEQNYEASLLPLAEVGSVCRILRMNQEDDVDNITAPIDERQVFMKRYRTFKVENLNDSIREFVLDYAV